MVTAANITSWGSIHKLRLEQSDIWLIQEHKLVKEEAIKVQTLKLRKAGWHSAWSKAKLTAKGKPSEGVAILWRKDIKVREEEEVVVEGRVIRQSFAWGPGLNLSVYSLYGHSGIELGQDKISLFEGVVAHANLRNEPCLIGGDFNASSWSFEGWADQCIKGWKVYAPEDFTCVGHDSASTLDYFVGNRALSALIQAGSKVETDRSHRVATHIPVTMSLSQEAVQSVVKVLAKPKVKPEDRPVVGPHWPNGEGFGWENWADVVSQEVGKWIGRDKTMASDDPQLKAANIGLQRLYDKWESMVLPELQDLFGQPELPPQEYVILDKKLGEVLRPKAKKDSKADQYEWVYRRMVELRATIKKGKKGIAVLQSLRKKAKDGGLPPGCEDLPSNIEQAVEKHCSRSSKKLLIKWSRCSKSVGETPSAWNKLRARPNGTSILRRQEKVEPAGPTVGPNLLK